MTTWRCQINGSNDTHHPTRIKNYWYLRFQIELPTWVSQPLGDTLTNETGFGVTLSALQWMIKKKDGCKWCVKMYQRSPSFQMSWAGWRFKKLAILHAYALFMKILIQMFNIVLIAKKLLPFSPSTHHHTPPLCRFTQLKAQSPINPSLFPTILRRHRNSFMVLSAWTSTSRRRTQGWEDFGGLGFKRGRTRGPSKCVHVLLYPSN